MTYRMHNWEPYWLFTMVYACVPHFNLWQGHKHPCSFQLRTGIALNLKSTRHYMGIDLGPFSISYLEAQVTWNFAYKSLDCFLSSLQVTWKPSHLTKSQVTSVADNGDMLGRSNIVICILYILKSISVTLYDMFYNISTKGSHNSLHW